jgi:hypothetical protein
MDITIYWPIYESYVARDRQGRVGQLKLILLLLLLLLLSLVTGFLSPLVLLPLSQW